MTQNINANVKITVLRRGINEDFVEKYADSPWGPCEKAAENQEFISHGVNIPKGFCSWAWCDIQKYVMTLARGGNFRGCKPGVFISCCTDGFRPTFFKIERIENESKNE
jgi:uncharacterized repeat protein (TIGR04076 family)